MALHIAKRIKAFSPNQTVLCSWPTYWGTPLETYKELIKLYDAGELSFKNVVTFNMDEYIGIPKTTLSHTALSCTEISSTT